MSWCTKCCCWGHAITACKNKHLVRDICGGPHDVHQHILYCDQCLRDENIVYLAECRNCGGPHATSSVECPIWKMQSNANRIQRFYNEQNIKIHIIWANQDKNVFSTNNKKLAEPDYAVPNTMLPHHDALNPTPPTDPPPHGYHPTTSPHAKPKKAPQVPKNQTTLNRFAMHGHLVVASVNQFSTPTDVNKSPSCESGRRSAKCRKQTTTCIRSIC